MKLRQPATLLLALVLVVASCSGEAVAPDSRPEPTGPPGSTTSTSPSTTSTAQPMSIDGAPPSLSSLVEDFYAFATGEGPTPPAVVKPVIDMIPIQPADVPHSGTASLGTFKGSEIATVEMADDLFLAVDDGEGWRVVGGRWPSLTPDAYYGPSPRLVAVVGSDARPGEAVDRTRADSIHFIALDGQGSGAVVGLPRDSYVPIPGFGTNKITASLALGGPDIMMEAFRDLTGLPLEGYLLTGFEGFDQLIDAVLGGVEVVVPFDINDKAAKATLQAGLQVLSGFDALAFARARKTVPGGDFTRSSHQGEILLGAAKTVQKLGFDSIPQLLQGSEQWLITDLGAEQVLTLSAAVISANLDEVPNIVVPGSVGTAGSASVVFLSEGADSVWTDLTDGSLGQ